MNYKRFKKYIVVDDNNKPMTFDVFEKDGSGQFCYCDSDQSRRPNAVKIYDLQTARLLIKKTKAYRKKRGFDKMDSVDKYNLMPVA